MLDMDQTVCPCCGTIVMSSDLPDDVEAAEVASRFPIRRTPALLFLILWNAKGRVVTFDTLMDAQARITHRNDGSVVGIRSSKKLILRAFRGYPMDIASISGMGYRMQLLDSNWHWRNEPYQ